MTLRYATSILLALALSTPLLAQSTDEQAERRFYDVEIVIFKNLKVPRSREFVLPARSPARSERMLDLASPASIAAARKQGYEVLPAKQLRLGDVVEKLVESERYELLVHTAWRQPGVELEQALPVWVRGGRVYGTEYISIDSRVPLQQQRRAPGAAAQSAALDIEPPLKPPRIEPGELYELEGKITVALGRYLHTYTDLVLRRPRRGAETLPDPATDAERYTDTDAWILNNHHLSEHRRMRSRNLHYLDNPEFSLLVLIHPYDPAESAAEPAPEPSAEDGIVLDSDLTPTEAAVTSQGQ